MSKVSVVIPSRNELFLPQTVNDLLTKAAGEVEVIVVLDGYWPDPPLPDDPRLRLLHFGSPRGMRAAINAGAGVATGEFLMKCDAHCMFQEGYDEILQADCDGDWAVIPARYSLDAENWAIEKNGKPRRDYHYLCYPDPHKEHDGGMHGVEWWQRCKERFGKPEYEIDDNMSCQGSCWLMPRDYFWNHLGGLSEEGYGTFSQEFQEIGNKIWLGGGRVVVNKKCWYAHLHKGKRYGRGYSANMHEIVGGHNYSSWFWMTNQPFKGRIHNIEWLIDKFWPVPTWPEDWREIEKTWRTIHVD